MISDITPQNSPDKKLIHSYGDSGFRLGDVFYHGSIFVFNESVTPWMANESHEYLIETLEEQVKETSDIGILIVGSGLKSSRPDSQLRSMLKSYKIVLEWMTTGAACRTYNVLMLEKRPVAAALIAV